MLENSGNGNGKVSKYTIMCEEVPVLLFDRKADAVTVYKSKSIQNEELILLHD